MAPNRLLKDAPRLFPEAEPRNCIRWIAPRPQPLLTALPDFGLLSGAVILVVVLLFMIFPDHAPYQGLLISLRGRQVASAPASPWRETLSVYLGEGEKFYVNGRAVSKEGLGAALQQELDHRAEWTIYFEADYDTLNMNAIYAMDTIQGLGAKLVWITPETRQEIEQERQLAQRIASKPF